MVHPGSQELVFYHPPTLTPGMVMAANPSLPSPKLPPNLLFICDHSFVKFYRQSTELGKYAWIRAAPASFTSPFLFLFRHKRKLKAIVAGSAGETVMGGEMRGQLGLLGAWSACLGEAQASPARVECTPLPSVPPPSSLQGTGASWTSWTCPIPTSIPSTGEWSPQALLGALRGGRPGSP